MPRQPAETASRAVCPVVLSRQDNWKLYPKNAPRVESPGAPRYSARHAADTKALPVVERGKQLFTGEICARTGVPSQHPCRSPCVECISLLG